MKPRIIFFDADGTLWIFKDLKDHAPQPQRTLRKASLDPAAPSLLKALKRRGIQSHIITYQSFSSHAHGKRKLKHWLAHFKLAPYIQDIHIANKKKDPKSQVIARILAEKKCKPREALLIGDRYRWDYQEARKALVPALLLAKPENKKYGIKTYTLAQIEKRFA